VKDFESRHNNIEEKLDDLIHLLIKYLPFPGNYFALADALEDIRLCNRDLNLHTFLEDAILVPKIQLLEKRRENQEPETKRGKREELSEREKEIAKRVAKGMSNKEIAEVLFLSVHTVITHRRNISRKLGIHSSAGLTVYAIINNLIDIDELRS
jgi:regulator of cell morphogenesis and NO signaling